MSASGLRGGIIVDHFGWDNTAIGGLCNTKTSPHMAPSWCPPSGDITAGNCYVYDLMLCETSVVAAVEAVNDDMLQCGASTALEKGQPWL